MPNGPLDHYEMGISISFTPKNKYGEVLDQTQFIHTTKTIKAANVTDLGKVLLKVEDLDAKS